MSCRIRSLVAGTVFFVVITGAGYSPSVFAHCDTLEGPVVQDARRALESGDVAPVLKWIGTADEPVIRQAFQAARTVRAQGEPAREMADRYFFETLVRVHRVGEGAPYEGLKSSETIPPVVVAADLALSVGSVDSLERKLSTALAEGIHQRFLLAKQLEAHAEESPEAGRKFVSAYVSYVHFVEEVHQLIAGGAHGHEGDAPHPAAR